MAIKLTPKEMAMRGLTPTGEKLKPEEEQKWLFPGGIDPRTGAMVAPTVPAIPTVPGVAGVPTGTKKPVMDVPKQPAQEEAKKKVSVAGLSKTPVLETGIILRLSDSERQELAVKAGQTTCLADQRKYEPRIYKATLKGGGYVLVEDANKKTAQQRATEAGYNVQRITWSPKYEGITTKPKTGIAQYQDSKGNYDLIDIANAYHNKEVTGNQLDKLFGSKGAHEVVVISDILTKLLPYKTGDGYLLSAALADRAVNTYEVGKVFSQTVVDNAVANRGAAATLSRYKDTSGNYDLIAISEALEAGRVKKDTIRSVLGNNAVIAAESISKTLKKLEPYKTSDGYLLTDALQKGAITQGEAAQIFSPDTIAQSTGWIALTKAPSPEEFGGKVTSTVATHTTQANKPGAVMPWKEAGLIAADIIVPYVYVARHWNELPVWERVLWITLDTVLFIIPMAGAGVRGARGVAVAAQQAGKLGKAARVAGALKNIGKEAWVIVKAPVETIIHPVAATKQGIKDFRSAFENVLRRKKIPEAVLTTTEGTVRLNITKATSADEFMRARDALMKAAAQGDTPLIVLRDKSGKTIATLQLAEAPLMRELKGGVVHSTPWGEKFRAGLTVEARANMPLSEWGLFVSHEPLPRFATQSAFNLPVDIGQQGRGVQTITTRFGANQVASIHLQKQLSQETIQALTKAKLIQTGDTLIQPLSNRNVSKLVKTLRESGNAKVAAMFEDTVASYKPIFRIMDPDTAKDIIASGKKYRGGVEMEAKLPVGARIEPPKQILVTRIGPQSTEVQLWLDKALSTRQIVKLKAEGLLEVFRQPFRFPLKIKGKIGSLSPAQVDDLARLVKGAGNPEVARSLERAYRLTQSARRMANIAAKAAAVAITRSAERVEAIMRAEGIQVIRGAEWLERSEPLQRIERTRAGKIVTRAARISRTQREARAERAARTRRPERVTRAPRERLGREAERVRGERPERPERVGRGERPVRPIRPVRMTRPIRPIRPVRPVRPIWPTRGKPSELVTSKVERKKLLEGPALATHKQGLFYISWYPQLGDTGALRVVYSRKRPPGARTATGRRSPQRTLKAIGKLPSVMELPMGVVTARVKHGRKLSFSRRNGPRRRGRVIE